MVIIIILTIVSSWSFIMRIKDTLSQHKKKKKKNMCFSPVDQVAAARRYWSVCGASLRSSPAAEVRRWRRSQPTVEKSSEAPWKCSDLKCCCHGAGSCFWWSPGFYGLKVLGNFTWNGVQFNIQLVDMGISGMMWKPWKDGGFFLKNSAKLGWKHWWLIR